MSPMPDVFIVSAVRTPIGVYPFRKPLSDFTCVICRFSCCVLAGSFCGKLSSFKGSELGTVVIREALKRATIEAKEVSEVIMGQVNVDFV